MPWLIVVIVVSILANRSNLPSLPLPEWLSYLICAILAVLGISLVVLGMNACPLSILGGRDRSVLITKGIYSYIRHPFCLSCIVLAFSASIGFRSTAGLLVAILALITACVRASFE